MSDHSEPTSLSSSLKVDDVREVEVAAENIVVEVREAVLVDAREMRRE